jgi:hypothetical protein
MYNFTFMPNAHKGTHSQTTEFLPSFKTQDLNLLVH